MIWRNVFFVREEEEDKNPRFTGLAKNSEKSQRKENLEKEEEEDN